MYKIGKANLRFPLPLNHSLLFFIQKLQQKYNQPFSNPTVVQQNSMHHHEFKTQQFVQIYKSKMHILIRILLIILLSAFTTLLFFDYDFSEAQLNLSSKTNCLDLGLTNAQYLCNMCFKVSPKNKIQEQIIVESQTPFMLISLKQQISGILSCQEWLQTVDYEQVSGEDPYYRQTIRLEPIINRFLNVLEQQKNEILLVQRPHISNKHNPTNLKQYSSLQRPYHILSYFSKTKNSKPFRVYLTNDLIKSQSIHILTLLTLAGNFALFYSFHCGQKKTNANKYRDNLFSLLGIVGTLVWWFIAGLQKSYDLHITYCKVIFFSLSMGVIFGGATVIFFGIFTILYTFITLQQVLALYRSFMQITLLFIVVIRLSSDIKNQYYHLQKNSNKKIFLLIMSLLVVGCSIASFIQDDTTLGQIFKFQQTFLMMISFLIATKNLDGDTYHKILNEHKSRTKNEHSLNSLGSAHDMYEDNQTLGDTQLKQIQK